MNFGTDLDCLENVWLYILLVSFSYFMLQEVRWGLFPFPTLFAKFFMLTIWCFPVSSFSNNAFNIIYFDVMPYNFMFYGFSYEHIF